MSREQVHKLLGGYATGTLTPEERQALFAAALEDQELFDALAREQSLRDLLRDPAAKAQLLAALDDAPVTWRQRAARWMWGHAVGLAAVACFVTVGGFVARQVHFTPPRVVVVATEPTRVEVHGSQPPAEPARPRPTFDIESVKKAAPPPPEMPPPPVVGQRSASVPLTRRNFTVDGITDLTGQPPRVPLPESAPAPQPPQPEAAGAMGGRGGGGRGLTEQVAVTAMATPVQTSSAPQSLQLADSGQTLKGRDMFAVLQTVPGVSFGNTYLTGGDATSTGTLTGTIVDSSNAAVPGVTIEVKNLTTGAARSTVSGPEGIFAFHSLEPSRYNLTAKATGFKTYETNNLNVTASAPRDLGKMPLTLGALTEEVSVTAAATPVRTASSENSKLVDSGQIADLALKGRNLLAILSTAGPQMAAAVPLGGGKLDPALVALVQQVRTGARPGAKESRVVSGGVANVRMTLTDASADSLAQLRKAGFTITRQERNELTGHIAVEKLDAITQLAFVVWIAPR